MGKTFDQSLIDAATIPMSMIDPEDMEDTNSEEFISLRRVQQGCHTELSNRDDFPFNKYNKKIVLTKNQNAYSLPDGRVTQVILKDNGQVVQLPYVESISLLADAKGRPDRYTINFNPLKIYFYPTPEIAYNVEIEYNSTKNIILTDNTYSYIIQPGSTLRMPEQFQHLYFDALEYYVLATNMRKQSNPRWQPTLAIFEQRWQTFLKGSKSVDTDTIFTIF